MDTTLKALRDITLKSDNRPAPMGFLPKMQIKPSQGPTRALPYIPNIRDLRGKDEFIRNNRLNISMEGSAERPGYQYTDSHTNKSFDMDITKGDGFSSNGAGYPRKAGFTKNMFIIHKEKTLFSGTRQGDKTINDEDEERILLRKLQETREKKEAILRMMAENEKRQKEKEAFQERILKLRNDSAQKIQVRWRIYREYQASRKQNEAKKSETIKKIVSRCESLLSQVRERLVQENSSLLKNIQVIQRNIRKFLAKKKLKGLWRRKISAFLQQKIGQTLFKSQAAPAFLLLKNYTPVKIEDNSTTFFVTSNPVINGYTVPTQDSEFDELSQGRNFRGSSRGRSVGSPKSSTHICKKQHSAKKNEGIFSLNNTSITSLHTGLEQHLEPGQIIKKKSSKQNVDAKSIINISETANPEDEVTTRKVVKNTKAAASLPPKSIQSLSSVDSSKKANERRAFKVWSHKV